MQIAEQISKNKLEMSTKMNQIYFEDKKIIEQLEIPNPNESVMEDEGASMNTKSKTSTGGDDVYLSIANKHEQT